MLILLRGCIDTKAQSLVSENYIISSTRSNIPRVGFQFDLIKTPTQIKLRKHTVLPFRLSSTSSTAGMGKLSRTIASLAIRISTHKRMSPDGFGATTTGLIHVVGPSTLSIMSFSRSSLTLAVTLSSKVNGILRIFWTTGIT